LLHPNLRSYKCRIRAEDHLCNGQALSGCVSRQFLQLAVAVLPYRHMSSGSSSYTRYYGPRAFSSLITLSFTLFHGITLFFCAMKLPEPSSLVMRLRPQLCNRQTHSRIGSSHVLSHIHPCYSFPLFACKIHRISMRKCGCLKCLCAIC
jgi:hypothetical protein